MKSFIPVRKSSLPLLLSLFFSYFSNDVYSQKGSRGKEKTIADNTYGAGGSKTTFSTHNVELILFRDANKNRRLLENTIAYKDSSEIARTNAKTYFDCQGQRSYVNTQSFDRQGVLVQQLLSRFSDDTRLSGSGWTTNNNARIVYNFNTNNKKFETGGSFNDDRYNSDYTACPAIILKLQKPLFAYSLTGKDHYKSTTSNNEYSAGSLEIEAYEDYDDYDDETFYVEHKKYHDKNGVLRHEIYREYYEDGCEYEEEYYYDCYGMLQYRGYTWYDSEGYEYELTDEYYKNGEQTAGYYYYDGYYEGDEEYYDPKKEMWVYGWHPGLPGPSDFEPDRDDCPKRVITPNAIYAALSLIREDDGGDGFNLYGGEVSYTRYLSVRGGLTGDIGAYFGNYFDTKYTKILALAGVTYLPVKTAALNDQFTFSAHLLGGITYLSQKYDSNNYSSKSNLTSFTLDAGLGLQYNFSSNMGAGIKIGAVPTFNKGNTPFNFRVSAGIEFR